MASNNKVVGLPKPGLSLISEREINKMIPYIIASKGITLLGTNLTKEVEDHRKL